MKRLWLATGLVPVAIVAMASCVGDDPEASGAIAANDGAAADGSADGDVPFGPIVTAEYRAGSRLEPNWLTLPDGSKQFVDWWDTVLKVHCSFTMVSGSYRCVPKVAAEAFYGEAFFSSSSCSTQAYWWQSGCSDVGAYAAENACPPKIFRLTPSIIQSAWEPSGGCHVAQTAGKFAEKGQEVPPSEWAAAELEEYAPPDAGAPLPVKALFVRGSDGSYGFHHWELRAAATACEFKSANDDGAYRCEPTFLGSAGGSFVDKDCSDPFVSYLGGSNCPLEEAKIAGVRTTLDPDACYPKQTTDTYFLVGQRYVGDTYYRQADGRCAAGGAVQGWRVGAKADIDVGRVELTKPSGALALEPVYGVFGDRSRVAIGLYDGRHATRCTFGAAPAKDGKWRCLPLSKGVLGSIYTDAACTQSKRAIVVAHPRIQIGKPECIPQQEPGCTDPATIACDPPPKPAYLTYVEGVCAADRRTVVLAPGNAIPRFYQRDFRGQCVAHTVVRAEAYYEATEVDPTEFPEAAASYR